MEEKSLPLVSRKCYLLYLSIVLFNVITSLFYLFGSSLAGLVEPGLKIDSPKEIVVIELLMSVNSGTGFFALARPNL